MNRVAANRAGKQFPTDIWKPIACNAAQPVASVKNKKKNDANRSAFSIAVRDGATGRWPWVEEIKSKPWSRLG